MMRYIATFHTHFAALCTYRAMQKAGISAEMAPVPRKLSAYCGTCVRYDADATCEALLHADFDRVVQVSDGGEYQQVISNDSPV